MEDRQCAVCQASFIPAAPHNYVCGKCRNRIPEQSAREVEERALVALRHNGAFTVEPIETTAPNKYV